MHLITYSQGKTPRIGILLGDVAIDLLRANVLMSRQQRIKRPPHFPKTLIDVIGSSEWLSRCKQIVAYVESHIAANTEREIEAVLHKTGAIALLPPVLKPSKVIGVGMNFKSFVRQIGEPYPKHPVLFHKTSTALVGSGSPIHIPPITDEAVPEGELAVIIGKRGKAVRPEDAYNHIAGYTCANDVSARNIEFRTSQWTSGKMLDTFCPLGPAIVTPDEVGNPHGLTIKTILNDIVIQEGCTSDLVFSIPDIISEISALATLEVGDVILTGTPSDLGETDPPVFLGHGDQIMVSIGGVGLLHNHVIKDNLPAK